MNRSYIKFQFVYYYQIIVKLTSYNSLGCTLCLVLISKCMVWYLMNISLLAVHASHFRIVNNTVVVSSPSFPDSVPWCLGAYGFHRGLFPEEHGAAD